MVRMGEDVERRPLFDHLAAIEDDHLIRNALHHRHLMRNEQHGQVELPVDALQ